jgi:hypothetical protein
VQPVIVLPPRPAPRRRSTGSAAARAGAGLLVVGWCCAAGLAACSSGSSDAPATTSSAPAAGAGETLATLGTADCAELLGASADLLVSSSTAEATEAATKLRAFSPPPAVEADIAAIVAAGGGVSEATAVSDADDAVSGWVDERCPTPG